MPDTTVPTTRPPRRRPVDRDVCPGEGGLACERPAGHLKDGILHKEPAAGTGGDA